MGAPNFSSTSSSNPATYAAVVTPGTSFGQPARAFYVGVSGNLVLTMGDGTNVTFLNVPVGVFPVGAVAVVAAGTTASGIVALY